MPMAHTNVLARADVHTYIAHPQQTIQLGRPAHGHTHLILATYACVGGGKGGGFGTK